jgi:sulfur carrier protein
MSILVNGTTQECRDDETLDDLVARAFPSNTTRGIAVVVNDEVVPRARWKDIKLVNHTKIEILRATAGG